VIARAAFLLLLLALAPALAGCGKKPAELQAPQGERQDTFPRTYPST
jgi:hypothetical protein